MKSKKSHSKKIVFDLSVLKGLSILLFLSSPKDVISDIDYMESCPDISR